MLHAAGPDQSLDIDGRRRFSLGVPSGGGVILVPGHGGDPVIQNDDRSRRAVIFHVDEAGDSRMEEGGIPDDRHHIFRKILAPGHFHAVSHGDGTTHAERRIHSGKRRQRPQGIAADIAAHRLFQLVKHIEHRPVGTSRAEKRRPAGRRRSVQMRGIHP